MKTPSPIRDDVEELEEKVASMKETFGSIAADPASVVPEALSTICRGHELADVDKAIASALEPQTKEESDAFVAVVGSRLVEAIVVSSKGSWVFITQVEAYFRGNKNVDDCANTTITVEHPECPKFVVEQKREYQIQRTSRS
ncbi:unnamed protein product [Mucor fragilis]